MLLANLVMAAGPSALILWWLSRVDKAAGRRSGALLAVFGLGVAAVAFAVVVGVLASPILTRLPEWAGHLVEAFVLAGLIEELAKLLVITGYLRRTPDRDRITDAVIVGAAASLGFAVIENAIYVVGPTWALLLRGLTAVPIHASCGAIIGYFLGRSLVGTVRLSVAGLGFAVVIHGGYDFLLLVRGPLAYLSIVIVVAGAAAAMLLYADAATRDRSAGRSTGRSI